MVQSKPIQIKSTYSTHPQPLDHPFKNRINAIQKNTRSQSKSESAIAKTPIAYAR